MQEKRVLHKHYFPIFLIKNKKHVDSNHFLDTITGIILIWLINHYLTEDFIAKTLPNLNNIQRSKQLLNKLIPFIDSGMNQQSWIVSQQYHHSSWIDSA